MAKRKCRMTEHEIDIHKQAVALRKMTDEQLVNAFNENEERRKPKVCVIQTKPLADEMVVSIKKSQEESSQPLTLASESASTNLSPNIDSLLHDLSVGHIKGIGKATTDKLIEYCLKKGYSRFGMKDA